MTIYGGEMTANGVVEGGFFVVCTKCGWHSEVQVSYNHNAMTFYCNHCHNEVNIR